MKHINVRGADRTESIKRLGGGGMIVTYRCTASCGHCLVASSPAREGAYMDAETARDILRRVKHMGCAALHIGGGEPFLSVDGLCAVLHIMGEEGVDTDYVETNAFWATSPKKAREIIRRVMDARPVTLMFSLCPYHAAYVPVERVKNAVAAARSLGAAYFLWQERFVQELAAMGDTGRTHTLEEYEAAFPGGVDALPKRFGLRLLGRAALTHKNMADTPYTDLPDGAPCRAMLRTSHFHVDLCGRYIPPGCPGFAVPIGALDNIGGEAHPAIRLLLEGGVRALYERACALGFAPQDAYIDKCALCQHARAFLALRAKGFHDLSPSGFYAELYPEYT